MWVTGAERTWYLKDTAAPICDPSSRVTGTTRRNILSLVPIAVLAVASVMAALLSATSSSGPSGVYRDAFRALPRGMAAFGQLQFTRLSDSQLSQVRITPTAAARIVTDQFGTMEPWRVVFESLGGYVNDEQIIHDWVGTTSLIPKAVPSYIVRITGGTMSPLAPGNTPNRYLNVIVNATTGRVVGSFTYD